MDNLNLISNFAEFKELKNIDKSTMIGVLEDVFRHALQKQYETDENFDVIINPEKGDLEIWRNRTVVEDGAVENPNTQIAVSEVKAIDPTYEIGDEYADEIKLASFGRRAVLSLRQNLASRILDLEKASLYEKYSEKVGEIVTGEVYQVWKKEVLILDDEENELILPKAEQIPNDFYRKGDTIKAIVKSVEMNNNQPRIILSRTANQFLERLFEQEVPEIADGLITIKKIARIPGERAKVAVESYDDRVDPVGACVGMKGSRIYSIVKELRNENIDVVNWTSNSQLLIQRALNPAKISAEEFLRISPFALQPVPWAKNGFYYGTEDRPGRHPWHEAGVYYIQEPSAMSVAELAGVQPGEVYTVPISHGEGRFMASQALLTDLAANGQIITQYADFDGNATMEMQHTPNGSDWAVEGIISPDGRVLGKMGHSERIGSGLYQNVPGRFDMQMFTSAVQYFK